MMARLDSARDIRCKQFIQRQPDNSHQNMRAGGDDRGARTIDAEATGECLFGIDIGTTAIKCAVVSASDWEVLAASSATIAEIQVTERAGQDETPVNHGEQCVDQVVLAVQRAIAALPLPLREQIQSVGICGQVSLLLCEVPSRLRS